MAISPAWVQDVVAAALPHGWCLEDDHEQVMVDGLTVHIAPVPRLAVQGMDAEEIKALICHAVTEITS